VMVSTGQTPTHPAQEMHRPWWTSTFAILPGDRFVVEKGKASRRFRTRTRSPH
jgi:hypothetical protein